jgi:hypothetical protein
VSYGTDIVYLNLVDITDITDITESTFESSKSQKRKPTQKRTRAMNDER